MIAREQRFTQDNQPNFATLVLMQTGTSPQEANITWFTEWPLLSVTC